ncbi:MAG: hypothetical protein AB7G76_06300 [Steroidobacteraceae bacterium]
MTDLTQAEHAERFGQVARNLQRVALGLLQDQARTGLDAVDVCKVFMSASTALLIANFGEGGTVDYLRALADQIEAHEPPTTN